MDNINTTNKSFLKKGQLLTDKYQIIKDGIQQNSKVETFEVINIENNNQYFVMRIRERKLSKFCQFMYERTKKFNDNLKNKFYFPNELLIVNSELFVIYPLLPQNMIKLSAYMKKKRQLKELNVCYIIRFIYEAIKPLFDLNIESIDLSYLINEEYIYIMDSIGEPLNNEFLIKIDLLAPSTINLSLSGTNGYMSRLKSKMFEMAKKDQFSFFSNSFVWNLGNLTFLMLTGEKVKSLSDRIYFSKDIPSDECLKFLKVTLQFNPKMKINFSSLDKLDFLSNKVSRSYENRSRFLNSLSISSFDATNKSINLTLIDDTNFTDSDNEIGDDYDDDEYFDEIYEIKTNYSLQFFKYGTNEFDLTNINQTKLRETFENNNKEDDNYIKKLIHKVYIPSYPEIE